MNKRDVKKRKHLPNVGIVWLRLGVRADPPLELDARGERAALGSPLPGEVAVGHHFAHVVHVRELVAVFVVGAILARC